MNVIQVIFKNKTIECQKFSRIYAGFGINYFKANNTNQLTQKNLLNVFSLISRISMF